MEKLASTVELPPHPLENIMLPNSLPSAMKATEQKQTNKNHLPLKPTQEQTGSNQERDKYTDWIPDLTKPINDERLLKMIEVYVDDFIGLMQAESIEELQHFTRATLHGINIVFPDGTSIKKLKKEGAWETRKETLGWILDCVARTMELPAKKIEVIRQGITQSLRNGYVTHKDLQRLNGKIRHAALGMPWANGLFAPINKALGRDVKMHRLAKNSPLAMALRDARTMTRLVAENQPCSTW